MKKYAPTSMASEPFAKPGQSLSINRDLNVHHTDNDESDQTALADLSLQLAYLIIVLSSRGSFQMAILLKMLWY